MRRTASMAMSLIALGIAHPLTARADLIYYTTGPTAAGSEIRAANVDGTGVHTILNQANSRFGGIAFDTPHGYLYSNDANTLFRSNLDGSGRVDLVQNSWGGYFGDTELDLANGKIYFSVASVSPTRLFSANLDGSGVQQLYQLGSGNVEGIALDPLAGKVYYANGNILGSSLDGSNPGIFRSLPFGSSPFEVEIDKANGYLYWNNQSHDLTLNLIQRARLDGSGPIENLVSAGNNIFSNGMTFDPIDQKIYYQLATITGTSLGLYRADADGSNQQFLFNDPAGFNYIEVLHTTAVPEPSSLALAGIGWLVVLGTCYRRRRWAASQ